MNTLRILKSGANTKPRIVILGCGWAGYGLARVLKKSRFDVTLVSPRNHFLFTPLLATTTVGTLEFRNISEPARNLRNVKYIQASCDTVAPAENAVVCHNKNIPGHKFTLNYDMLVVAPGAASNTFNVPGVEQNCFFLKQLSDARAIRNRISEVFERSNVPGIDEKTKRQLLTFVIVGAGPASIEFAAELHDFLQRDAMHCFPDFRNYLQIHLVEATNNILGMFSKKLQEYTLNMYRGRNVNVILETSVKKVEKGSITLSTGKVIKSSTIFWNTGNKMLPFVSALPLAKEKRSGRILTDQFNRARADDGKTIENVFALGDSSVNEKKQLPPTAQVAYQQALWLAKQLNSGDCSREMDPFKYVHRGTLAYVGEHKALADTDLAQIKGVPAWIFWNSVYLSQLFSLKNKVMVPLSWGMNYVFGRNTSSF